MSARYPRSGLFPPFSDCLLELTEGQKSALMAYDDARNSDDEELKRGVAYHLEAWDRHYGRESTLVTRQRRNEALRVWQPWMFENGGGI